MCVSLDAYSSCLCLKISKKASFTKSPGAFLKVSCLELSSGVGQSTWMWGLRTVSQGCPWRSTGSGSNGFNPYSGNQDSHVTGQQSPNAATRETCAPQLLNLQATMKAQQTKKLNFFFLRTVSRVTIALWVSWSQALLTFLLNVLWTSLFGSGLNSCGARCGVQAVNSSSRGSGFWVMLTVVGCSELWFMTRLCLSLSYPLQCGLFLFALRVRIDQLVLLSPKTTPQEIFYVALNSLYSWENVSSVCYFFEPEHPRIFLF